MIDYEAVLRRYQVQPKGVLHIGGFDGAENGRYEAMGFANRLFVEAQPDTFAKLAKNLEGTNAFCENYAISDRGGKAKLHVANNGQSTSILPMAKHRDVYPHIEQTSELEIETIRVDDLLARSKYASLQFNFMNVDIQGAELLALSGATVALTTFEILNLEINFDRLYEGVPHVTQIDAFLSAFDFVRADTVLAHATWGDAIYVKDRLTKV